jgi:hypothetical protein
MSIEQIERQIQGLPPSDLIRLAEWFSGFLAAQTPSDTLPVVEWRETPEFVAELDRRLAEFTANPGIAVPFEPDYFDRLKRQLEDERVKTAPARQG